MIRMRWCLLAALSAGLVMSACTDSGGSGLPLPCTNGVCQLGYTCMAGLCVPGAAETGETETGGDPTDGYGTIRIEVSPAGGDASILDGTTEVTVTVNYQSCARDFYLDNPELAADGPDGMPVFEAFLYKLCADFEGTPECQVEDIRQNLILANDVYSLTVTYLMGDPASIIGNEFRIGPLPTSELAGCPAQVELRQPGLIGKNQAGDQIWRISSLPGMNIAETEQVAPLLVEVTPL